MCKQLISLGVPSENILIIEDVLQDEKIRLHKSHLIPHEKLSFGVELARHCNLNCRCCSHYSPLSKKEFLNIDTYQKDIVRLSEIFGGQLEEIFFLGGEPLLNPDINEFLKITVKILPNTEIHIITNGILIPNMPQSFWEVCRSCNVDFSVSVYPIKLDYKSVMQKIRDEGVKISFYVSSAESGDFMLLPFDFSGKQDPKESFVNCPSANNCITLFDGKLSTCVAIAYIDTFNKFFKTNMLPTDEDYIDIYETDSAEEILKFLAKPVPFCRFCDVSRIHDIAWGRSKKEITEWSNCI